MKMNTGIIFQEPNAMQSTYIDHKVVKRKRNKTKKKTGGYTNTHMHAGSCVAYHRQMLPNHILHIEKTTLFSNTQA